MASSLCICSSTGPIAVREKKTVIGQLEEQMQIEDGCNFIFSSPWPIVIFFLLDDLVADVTDLYRSS